MKVEWRRGSELIHFLTLPNAASVSSTMRLVYKVITGRTIEKWSWIPYFQ